MYTKSITESVCEALVYASLFNFPLTEEELHLRLHTSKEITDAQLKTIIQNLIDKKVIVTRKGYYGLVGSYMDWDRRVNQLKMADTKGQLINKIIMSVSKIPWIECILVTGSIAARNIKPKDDIDLLIITAPNRLWIVRLLLIVILELKGIRRRPEQQVHQNKVCLNMFLESQHCTIPVSKQNLYTAYELMQAVCVWDKNNTHNTLLHSNVWAKKYLANWYVHKTKNTDKQHILENDNTSKTIFTPIVNICNLVLYKIQSVYMKKRKTSEQITLQQAFFHPKRMHREILASFELSKKSIC